MLASPACRRRRHSIQFRALAPLYHCSIPLLPCSCVRWSWLVMRRRRIWWHKGSSWKNERWQKRGCWEFPLTPPKLCCCCWKVAFCCLLTSICIKKTEEIVFEVFFLVLRAKRKLRMVKLPVTVETQRYRFMKIINAKRSRNNLAAVWTSLKERKNP